MIDRRVQSGKPMIITTNLSMAILKGEENVDKKRIYDRILGCCVPIKFEGESKRKLCARNNLLMVKKMNSKVKGARLVSNYDIPYWKKYTLSIEEAVAYFRIGESKLRKIASENPNAEYLLWNGNRVQIKRELFERFVDSVNVL